MISFLLQDEYLIPKVTRELQATFRQDGSLDIAALQTDTPYLTALWHETLRVCNSSASARFVTSDTKIGEYTLRAGRRLLIPYRQLHLNPDIFGANATEFNASRFLEDKKLAQNPSYRPFGGGVTYCPGRFLAKQEIFMALAFLLCRNDVQLASVKNEGGKSSGQKFPRMDELKPGIGIIGPVSGDDLIVRLTPKVVCMMAYA
jgi:cytochrome P450